MATSQDPPDVDDVPIRPFLDWLRDHNQGQTADEMSEAIHLLTGRVQDTGKAGSVQLTIRIEPMKGASNNDIVLVTDQIKTKLPEFPRQSSVFYVDKHGNQVRNDPNQLTFESLREVPPIEVDKTTGEIKENKA